MAPAEHPLAQYTLYRPTTNDEEQTTTAVLNTFALQGYRIIHIIPNFWHPKKPLYILELGDPTQ
jgi:hypothetical protein